MIDGLGIGDVGTVVLRDRQQIATEGIVVIVVPVEQSSGKVMSTKGQGKGSIRKPAKDRSVEEAAVPDGPGGTGEVASFPVGSKRRTL